MAGTFSDWIIKMQEAGFHDLAMEFHSEKFQDYKRLKESGLPIFDDFIVLFNQFKKENENLREFLSKYKGFVIRAIPNTRELPRRYKIGVSDFDGCQKFLEQTILPQHKEKYSILLTEHEPTDWAGIIISRQNNVLIEVAQSGLDELSGGKVIPSGGYFAYHDFKPFQSMKYNTENIKEMELMWGALQYLRKDLSSDLNLLPNINFIKGYFEFVKTKKTNKIKFLDFKINKSYLK